MPHVLNIDDAFSREKFAKYYNHWFPHTFISKSVIPTHNHPWTLTLTSFKISEVFFLLNKPPAFSILKLTVNLSDEGRRRKDFQISIGILCQWKQNRTCFCPSQFKSWPVHPSFAVVLRGYKSFLGQRLFFPNTLVYTEDNGN